MHCINPRFTYFTYLRYRQTDDTDDTDRRTQHLVCATASMVIIQYLFAKTWLKWQGARSPDALRIH